MPTVTATAILNPAQYEAMAGSPPVVPTQRQLFDYQVGIWSGNGMATEDQLRPLAQFVPDSGLFVIVPPRPPKPDSVRLMGYIELNGKRGVSYLIPTHLTDEVRVPEGPYLVLDIEDGRSRLNIAPRDSRASIAAANRWPYVWFEGIVHATVFPMVLGHHNINLVGSRYGSANCPCLYVENDEPPTLNYARENYALPRWGAASCGSRKGLRA